MSVKIQASARLLASKASETQAVKYIKETSGIDVAGRKATEREGTISFRITGDEFKAAVPRLKKTVGKPRVRGGSYYFSVSEHRSIALVPSGRYKEYLISLSDLAAAQS